MLFTNIEIPDIPPITKLCGLKKTLKAKATKKQPIIKKVYLFNLFFFVNTFNISLPYRRERNSYAKHRFLCFFGKKVVRRPQQVRAMKFGECP
jgi:hypothetical protein